MSLTYSPKIATDGLLMYLDASNNKSYPTDLPVKNGLTLWLDAADDTTFSYSSGTVVSQWRDKSGNNFHANQSTTAQQPSRNTINNSRKSVFFNAASRLDYMTISSGISLPTDTSIFIVYKPSSQIYEYAVLIDNYHGQGGNYGFVIQRVSTNAQFYYVNGDGSSFVGTSDSPWTYTNNVIQLLSLNKSSSTGTPYISGTAQTSRTVHANTVQDTTGLAIGTWGLGGREYNGDMCEIIIFNRSLSSTEMKQVHTYLGQKWGISNTDRSIIDLSTNNYSALLGNGTTANMPLFDVYNKGALKFDGSNDYITTGVSSIVPTSTAAYTVSVWCYRNTNNSSYKELLAQWTNANSGNSFYFGFENSNVRFTDNWQPVTVSGAGNTNVWMNLVGVYTVSNAYIYLNGVLAATKGSGFTYTGTGPLIIGRQGELNGEYFDGNISNVLIYNRALSATEVAQNYEAQKSKFANTIVQQGLVLNLDAGNPYSYAGAGTTWYDVSGNSNNGTLTNGPTYNADVGGNIVFDGSNDYVAVTSAASIKNTSTLSLEGWVFISSAMNYYGGIIGKGTSDTDEEYCLLVHSVNSKVYMDVGSSGGPYTDATFSFSLNTWYHIIGTHERITGSSTIKIYVNGSLLSSTTVNPTNAVNDNATNVSVGSRFNGGTSVWNGKIATARIYTRTLSAAEVLQNYNATKGRFGL